METLRRFLYGGHCFSTGLSTYSPGLIVFLFLEFRHCEHVARLLSGGRVDVEVLHEHLRLT